MLGGYSVGFTFASPILPSVEWPQGLNGFAGDVFVIHPYLRPSAEYLLLTLFEQVSTVWIARCFL